MIEIICDKKDDYKDENEEVTMEDTFKLPKNLRQVGSPSGSTRIYIEDYVVTYLNYIARPGNTDVRGAILVGEKKMTRQGDAIFISGAVDAQNIEFDMEECHFSDAVWTEIYEQIKDNFPDLSVVGWFLSRMGFSTAINPRIEKLHIENFPGSDKVLYVSDSLESEDAFYIYERGQMIKQKGYYIYYARNEQMQNYIIKKRGDNVGETQTDIKRKDDELIRNYREKTSQAMDYRGYNMGFSYVAGSFLALVVLAMGITVVGNYKRMRNMEVSINRLELTSSPVEKTEDEVAPSALVVSPDNTISTGEIANAPVVGDTENVIPNGTDNILSSEEGATGGVNSSEELTGLGEGNSSEEVTGVEGGNSSSDGELAEATDVSVSIGNSSIYKVRYGDTLSSIAETYYGDIKYVYDIARANNISSDGRIYEGQELMLPDK